MSPPIYKAPEPKKETRRSIFLGVGFALGLFVLMGLAQMMGKVDPPKSHVEEVVMGYTPPDLSELEEEEPPPPEEEEPPPELEAEQAELSLDQLDIALNPGTGGSLAGDFAMPVVRASARSLGTEDFVDFSQLDQVPRPIGVSGFNFPSRLLKKKVNGRIVLVVRIDTSGEVLDAEIESSDLPAFSDFVLKAVRDWRFTPPTLQGRPVKARARLPIPININ